MTCCKDQRTSLKSLFVIYVGAICLSGFFLLGFATHICRLRLWTCPTLSIVYVGIWISLVIGILMLCVAALALCVIIASFEFCSLRFYAAYITTSTILLLIVIIWCGKMQQDMIGEDGLFAAKLMNMFIEAKSELNAFSGSDGKASKSLACWNGLQSTLKCCGALKYSDWYTSSNSSDGLDPDNMSVPKSCVCLQGHPMSRTCLNHTIDDVPSPMAVYSQGCIPPLKAIITSHLRVFIILPSFIASWQIVHGLITVFLAIRMRRLSVVHTYSLNGMAETSNGSNPCAI